MASRDGLVFDPVGDPIVDALWSGFAWDLREENTLFWAVSDGFDGNAFANQLAAIEQFQRAVDAFEAFIDVEFSDLGFFEDPIAAGNAGADIVYSVDKSLDPTGSTLAYSYFPGGNAAFPDRNPNVGGDIFINVSHELISRSSFSAGSDGFFTIIHELGHAMGLRHPFERWADRPSVADIGRSDMRDIDFFTIMSYTDPYENQLERWDPATLMVWDVLVLQFIYGANPSTNVGDTRHILDGRDHYYSIWDASGVDLVEGSNLSQGWRIELPDVALSQELTTLIGFAAPLSQISQSLDVSRPRELVWLLGDLENLSGSSRGDELIGNLYANTIHGAVGNDLLQGNYGDDTLDGGLGVDTAAYSGNQASYTVAFTTTGITIADRRADQDGMDKLISVEQLSFVDGYFDLGIRSGAVGLSTDDFAAISEIYIAYFNRAPASSGLLYWATRLADGMPIEKIAQSFFEQPETQATYAVYLNSDGSLRDTEAFVTTVFNNLLGRDPSGTYWVNELNENPSMTPPIFILSVLNGARAQTGGEDDVAYMQDKTEIGVYFSAIKGLSNFEDAVAVMSLYDGSDDSVKSAVAAIDHAYADALDPNNGEFLMPLIGLVNNPFADYEFTSL